MELSNDVTTGIKSGAFHYIYRLKAIHASNRPFEIKNLKRNVAIKATQFAVSFIIFYNVYEVLLFSTMSMR